MTFPTPDEVHAMADRINQQYTIHVHHSPSILQPWWATITHGVMHVGDAYGGVWRARSRERLVEKTIRWCERNARRSGITEPVIKVDERTP